MPTVRVLRATASRASEKPAISGMHGDEATERETRKHLHLLDSSKDDVERRVDGDHEIPFPVAGEPQHQHRTR